MFTRDHANRLTQVTEGSLTTQFAYNGDGVRTSKTVAGDTMEYVLDLAATLPVVISDTEAVYLYGLDIIAQQQAERLYYAHDGLGSVRQLLDTTGQIETNYAYDPFGVPLVGGEVYNPYQSTGEAWDGEVELLYLRARYYQPETGRFITKDPWLGEVWRPGTLNLYVYAMDNPIGLGDPTGMQAEEFLREIDRVFRRSVTGPVFGGRSVVLNAPAILHHANAYGVDPALLAAIVYWESDAIERLPLNIASVLPFWSRSRLRTCVDLDLWQFLLAGDASIGIGQTFVWRAKYLEDETGIVSPITPQAPILGREALLALRLTVDSESIRYVAANLADLQRIADEEDAQGLGLSDSDARVLMLAGYNAGQESIRTALRTAWDGDRRALDAMLRSRYAALEVGPIYDRLKELLG